MGITVLLALIGILVTAILLVKNIKGGILWGILITWGLGILCQFAGLYVPNPELGFFSLLLISPTESVFPVWRRPL